MSTVHKNDGEVIQHELCQIEDPMRQPDEGRVLMLRTLNDTQALTRVLPPETLSRIFEFICQFHCFVRTNYFPIFTLGRVSSHWRQVAWSTPQLWNRVSMVFDTDTARSRSHILELHLKNTRALPFYLELHFYHLRGVPVDLLINAFTPIGLLLFTQYPGKIRHLELCAAEVQWLRRFTSRFAQLEYLSVHDIDGNHLELDLTSIPRLRHVRLRIASGAITLPWSSITVLNLYHVPIDTCVELLTQCPNLLELHLTYPLDAQSPDRNPPTDTILLQSLQVLSWSHFRSPWCLATLQHIRVPSLHKLIWVMGEAKIEEVEPSLRALFANVSDTLRTLQLTDIICCPLPTIKHIFSRARYVRKLVVTICSRDTVYKILCALCPGWEGDESQYLPFLESFCVNPYHGRPPRGEAHTFSRRILDISRAKYCSISRPRNLRIKLVGAEVLWSPDIRAELCAMVRDGLGLRIYYQDRGVKRRVEWLS